MLLQGYDEGSLIFSLRFYQMKFTLFKRQFILTTARFCCCCCCCRSLTWHKISLLQVHLVQQRSDFKSIQTCPKTSLRWSACKSGSSLTKRMERKPGPTPCFSSCDFVAHPVLVLCPGWWWTFPCFLTHSPVWQWTAFHLCFSRASSLLINMLNDSRNNSTPLLHLWSYLGYCCTVSCPWLHLALWAAQDSTGLLWALPVLLLSLSACELPVPRFLRTRACCAPSCWYVHVFPFWSFSIKLPAIGSVTIAGAQVSDEFVEKQLKRCPSLQENHLSFLSSSPSTLWPSQVFLPAANGYSQEPLN